MDLGQVQERFAIQLLSVLQQPTRFGCRVRRNRPPNGTTRVTNRRIRWYLVSRNAEKTGISSGLSRFWAKIQLNFIPDKRTRPVP